MTSEDIPFSHFVDLIQTLSRIRPIPSPRHHTIHTSSSDTVNRATDTLFQWIESLRDRHTALRDGNARAFFRCLFPEEDNRRRYNMQEASLAKLLADAHGITTTPAARGACLLKWDEWSRETPHAGCLGAELGAILNQTFSGREDEGPTLLEIDALLDELATLSPYSQIGRKNTRFPRRTRTDILKHLYRPLKPDEAAILTQIILKDLRPVLYPNPALSTSAALLSYNSNAYHVLTKWAAMKLWHPDMTRIYRVCGSLDEASSATDSLRRDDLTQEQHQVFWTPMVGRPVEIPKAIKGQKCSHVVRQFAGSDAVYAETKYDGERMQIHVDMSLPFERQIKIFSKSKRDSTEDRIATHPIIRSALRVATNARLAVIVEAEMVAYSDLSGDIDEFWRIRSLIETTAVSVRHRPLLQHPSQSQNSLDSDASGGGSRHLMLVFFDILYFNGTSLLEESYETRREHLARVISCVPGMSMLAARTKIDLSGRVTDAEERVKHVFARSIAKFEEGLVFKAPKALYNDYRMPWIKLKRDYIPGLGDTADLVIIGAGWEKDRARELGVGTHTFTTFWIGCLANKDAIQGQRNVKPRFEMYFTAAYGLSRAALEELNFMINASGCHQYKSNDKHQKENSLEDASYEVSPLRGLPEPDVLLIKPLLAEVMGAGFTKADGSKYYELRFPRIIKVHRSSDRDWKEGIDLQELQEIARRCVGKDRQDKETHDCVSKMWGIEASPGPRSSQKRKERERALLEELTQAEASPFKRIKTKTTTIPLLHDQAKVFGARAAHQPTRTTAHSVFSVVPRSPITPGLFRTQGHKSPLDSDVESRKLFSPRIALSDVCPNSPHIDGQLPMTPPPTLPRAQPALDPIARAEQKSALSQHCPEIKDAISRVRAVFADVFICILQPRGSALARACIEARPRTQVIIPQGRLFHSVEGLLGAVGWFAPDSSLPASPVRHSARGFIFADPSESELMKTLIDGLGFRRNEIGERAKKEVVVLDAKILNWDMLPRFEEEFSSRVIWTSRV